MKSSAAAGAVIFSLVAGVVPACANTATVNFEGVTEFAVVGEFYNGGTDSLGSGPGTNYGVSFVNNFGGALLTTTFGGLAVSNPPSGNTVLGLAIRGADTLLNVAGGFNTSLSVYYSSWNSEVNISIYDGLNRTGNVLASVTPPFTQLSSCGANYCDWALLTVNFSGNAKSIGWSGNRASFAIDDLTLNVAQTPLPGALPLFATALGALGLLGWRRKRKQAAALTAA